MGRPAISAPIRPTPRHGVNTDPPDPGRRPEPPPAPPMPPPVVARSSTSNPAGEAFLNLAVLKYLFFD